MRDMVRKKPKNKHLRQKLANAVLVLDARTGEQKVAKEYYEKLFTKGTRNLSEISVISILGLLKSNTTKPLLLGY